MTAVVDVKEGAVASKVALFQLAENEYGIQNGCKYVANFTGLVLKVYIRTGILQNFMWL